MENNYEDKMTGEQYIDKLAGQSFFDEWFFECKFLHEPLNASKLWEKVLKKAEKDLVLITDKDDCDYEGVIWEWYEVVEV